MDAKEQDRLVLQLTQPVTRISDEDLDVLSGLMSLGFPLAERAMYHMEQEYSFRYHGSKAYQQLALGAGKIFADSVVKDDVIKQLRHDKRNEIGRLLESFKMTQARMDKFTQSIMKDRKDNVNVGDLYDALHANTNYWGYIFLLLSNVKDKEDYIKIESYIKLLAKGNSVSDTVLSLFEGKYNQ